jgi:hypothetical protein
MNLKLLFLFSISLHAELAGFVRSSLSPPSDPGEGGKVDVAFGPTHSSLHSSHRRVRRAERVLRIGVLAPDDPTLQYTLQKVLPPITLAVRSERVQRILPHWKIEVNDRNTKCSSTLGPLAAFEFYINKTAGLIQYDSDSSPPPGHTICYRIYRIQSQTELRERRREIHYLC